jgi:TPR repeat protein
MGPPAGCANRSALQYGAGAAGATAYQRSQPQTVDYPILLQEGQGTLDRLAAPDLLDRACQQGWADACIRVASDYIAGNGVARDVPRAIAAFERACDLKSWQACADLGAMLQKGDGTAVDAERGRNYLRRACEGGVRSACDGLERSGAGK